jgi:GntP family gluconate:H+ symporter
MPSPTLAILSPNGLLILAAVSIIGLILLIARFRCNAFVALAIASLSVGIGSGMPLANVAASFDGGVGKTLGGLAMIIGLGTILGKMLAESGAAHVIANQMVVWLGPKRLDYAIMIVAFLVGISIFFNVGFILLGPIAYMLARETKTPILRLALPMAAGLSTAHGLIPPHPGPMAAIALIHADTGKTILYGLLIGAPTSLLAGPLLARLVARLFADMDERPVAPRSPGFGISVFTLLLPVILMLAATAAKIGLPPENEFNQWAQLFGAPTVAMLIAALVSFWTFGFNCGLDGKQILKFSEVCLGPVAGLLLLIGAGGGFGQVIAGLLRISLGSATVSIQTAAALMVPIIQSKPGVNKELLILAMGSGSMILSHVNDSGFWFVKEYLGLTIMQTLKSWTVVETGIAIVSIILILIVNMFV